MAPTTASAPLAPGHTPFSQAGFTILVVDDSAINRRVIQGILQAEHYQVQLAGSGAMALDMVQASAPDLILLDVKMPGMDGPSVCRQLKGDSRTHAIPVVFLTAANDAETENQAFACGADDYIVKPINSPALLARVRNLLAQKIHTAGLAGQFRNLVQSTPVVYLFADENARITNANLVAAHKFGYPSTSDMVGLPLEQLVPGYQNHLPSVSPSPMGGPANSAGPLHTVEITCLGRSGRAFAVDATFSRMPSAQGEVLLLALHDISERKALQSDLGASRTLIRELAARSEAAREMERKHIARDVHDELGQVLSALRMEVFMLRRDYQKSVPELSEKLQTMCALVDRGIADVRAIASSLRPAALDSGLFAAIDSLRDEFVQRNAIACTLSFDDPGLHLDELRAVVLYRIVQESLTNISKYAGASAVDIALTSADARVRVTIRDNGCGFDMNETLQRKTYGILGMRERAIVLDGGLNVWSLPGHGTRIEVNFPLASAGPGEAL